MKQVTLPDLSRRSFLKLAAGFTLITIVGDLDRYVAFAEEDPNTGDMSYTIYVIKRWEVPITVLDVSADNDHEPVKGMKLHIKSFYNGATLDVKSNKKGIAIIDIRKLSEPDPDPEALARTQYSFNGSLIGKKDGYRVYETGRMRFTGTEPVDVATAPLDGKPYLQCVTLDGWDIQYAKDAVFCSTTGNNVNHDLVVKAVGYKGAVTVTASQEGAASYSTIAKTDKRGITSAKLTGKMESANPNDAKQAFAVSDKPIVVTVKPDDATLPTLTMNTTMKLMKGYIDTENVTKEKAFNITSLAPTESTDATDPPQIPPGIPFVGGSCIRVDVIAPKLPIQLYVDPYGYGLFSIAYAKGRDGHLFTTDKGQPAKNGYTANPFKQAKRAFDNRVQNYNSMKQNWQNAAANKQDPNHGIVNRIKQSGFGSFTVDLTGGFMAVFNWFTDCFSGDFVFFCTFSCHFSYTQYIFCGPVPLFGQVILGIDTRASIGAGFEISPGKKAKLSKGSSFTVQARPAVSLSIGVGNPLVSASVRGGGWFNLYFSVFYESQGKGKPNPHEHASTGFQVDIVVQAFIFKGSFKLYRIDKTLYETWETPAEPEAETTDDWFDDSYLVRLPDGSLGYSAAMTNDDAIMSYENLFTSENLVVTTTEQLASTAELSATPTNSSDSDEQYTYEPIPRGQNASSATETAIAPDVIEYVDGCLKASNGTVFDSVFSDPRTKIVNIGEQLWAFRIVTVNYLEGTRTRLSISTMNKGGWSWGVPCAIDFKPVYIGSDNGPARIDLYDYDFDVISATEALGAGKTWADGSVARVALTCGTREAGDNTTLGEAMGHTVLAFLAIDENFKKTTVRCYANTTSLNPYSKDKGVVSTFTFPRLKAFKDVRGEDVCAIFAFCRIGKDYASLAGDRGSDPYQEYPGMAMFNSMGGPFNEYCDFKFTEKSNIYVERELVDDVDAFLTTPKASVAITVDEVAEGHASFYCQTVFSVEKKIKNAEEAKPGDDFLSFVRGFIFYRPTKGGSAETKRLVGLCGLQGEAVHVEPWDALGKGAALCNEGKVLSIHSFDRKKQKPAENQQVSLGPNVQFGTYAFSQSASMLYYTQTNEGKQPPIVDDQGNETPQPDVTDYYIMASRCVIDAKGNYKFMEAFKLAKLDQRPDGLAFVDLGDAYGFMVNTITSLEKSQSDISYVSVPYVKKLTLHDFSPLNRFVCAGDDEQFNIQVSNDGNVSVSAFDLVISAYDGSYSKTIPIDLENSKDFVPIEGNQDIVPDEPERVVLDNETALAIIKAAGSGQSVSVQTTGGSDTAGDGEVTAVEAETKFDIPTEAGVLNPGKHRTYAFVWKIPEKWHGEVELNVEIAQSSIKTSSADAFPETDTATAAARCTDDLSVAAPDAVTMTLSAYSAVAGDRQESVHDVAMNPYFFDSDNGGEGENSESSDSPDPSNSSESSSGSLPDVDPSSSSASSSSESSASSGSSSADPGESSGESSGASSGEGSGASSPTSDSSPSSTSG